jgi:hypothetical protein
MVRIMDLDSPCRSGHIAAILQGLHAYQLTLLIR